ncbi:hypothetical protein [Streptomyces pulveraceus]|uniref:Uncharacterized protein n=1 Tax=Streptomyces pulveraceus TaxID=68258 RepID=A0ABW1GXT8_9ACTN
MQQWTEGPLADLLGAGLVHDRAGHLGMLLDPRLGGRGAGRVLGCLGVGGGVCCGVVDEELVEVLVDGGEDFFGLDHVEFDEWGQAGECQEWIGFCRRGAVAVDVAISDCLADDLRP